MSGFSDAWLALREPYDRRARNAAVLDAVASAFANHATLNVADLACGTGSTYRALSPHLPPGQRWPPVLCCSKKPNKAQRCFGIESSVSCSRTKI